MGGWSLWEMEGSQTRREEPSVVMGFWGGYEAPLGASYIGSYEQTAAARTLLCEEAVFLL